MTNIWYIFKLKYEYMIYKQNIILNAMLIVIVKYFILDFTKLRKFPGIF